MFEHIENRLELLMVDIADNVVALNTAITNLTTAVTSLQATATDIDTKVAAIAAPAAVDLTPVLDAIAGVAAQLQPTPAPATPALSVVGAGQ